MDSLLSDPFGNDPTDNLLQPPWSSGEDGLPVDADRGLNVQLPRSPLSVARPPSEPYLIPSPSALAREGAQQSHGAGSSAADGQWLPPSGLGLTPTGPPTRKTSVGSLLNMTDPSPSISQGISPAGLSLTDAFDVRQASPASAGDAWLRNPEPWDQTQQQRYHQLDGANVLRQHYRELHGQLPGLQHQQPEQQQQVKQQQVPASMGLAAAAWGQPGRQQQQHQQQQLSGMMPIAGVTGMVPTPSASIPVAATGQLQATAQQQQQQQQGAGQQEQETEDEADEALEQQQQQQQQQGQQQQPLLGKRKQQQQQQQVLGGIPPDMDVDKHSQQGFQQQQQQYLQGDTTAAAAAAAFDAQPLPGGTAAAGAGLPPTGPGKKKPSKKQQAAAAGGAAGSSTAAAAAPASLWKAPPLPKEPKIPKEPGVEYEEVLPPGMTVSNNRPLPVPVELLQLEDLGSILNLQTWTEELDEQERAQLRALLPNGGQGFDENPGGHLESLLSGKDNFCFGNPTERMWQDMQSGAAAPRLRRQKDMVLQLRQQLAATQLRNYHNKQVSKLLAMQHLWAEKLPLEASTAERVALWKAAEAGEVDMPESPRTAAKRARAEAAEAAAAAAVEKPSGGHGDKAAGTASGGEGGGRHAAGGAAGAGIGGSRPGVYVYEGPVDFSKNPTKRQQQAAAAAAEAAAAAAAEATAAAAAGGIGRQGRQMQGAGRANGLGMQYYQQQQQVPSSVAAVLNAAASAPVSAAAVMMGGGYVQQAGMPISYNQLAAAAAAAGQGGAGNVWQQQQLQQLLLQQQQLQQQQLLQQQQQMLLQQQQQGRR